MFCTMPVDITLIWGYVGGGGQSSGASGQLTQEHLVLKHLVFTLHLRVENCLKPEEKKAFMFVLVGNLTEKKPVIVLRALNYFSDSEKLFNILR